MSSKAAPRLANSERCPASPTRATQIAGTPCATARTRASIGCRMKARPANRAAIMASATPSTISMIPRRVAASTPAVAASVDRPTLTRSAPSTIAAGGTYPTMRSSPSVPVLSSVSARAAASSQPILRAHRLADEGRIRQAHQQRPVAIRDAERGPLRHRAGGEQPVEPPELLKAETDHARDPPVAVPEWQCDRQKALPGGFAWREAADMEPRLGPSRGGGPPLPAGERLRLIAALGGPRDRRHPILSTR